MNPSKNSSEEFPHPWWMKSVPQLEAGVICPTQSPWCNAVVLVHKKDGGLHFCIDFHKLNAWTKKDSYPLPKIQEAIESLVGGGYFSCLDLKGGFWQLAMDKSSKQYIAFTVGNPGFFKYKIYAFQAVQCPSDISEINAELPRGTKLDILLNLLGWPDSLLKDGGGALAVFACCVQSLLGTQPEAKTH